MLASCWPTSGSRRRKLASVVLLACALAGCDFPGRPDPAKRPILPSEVVEFDPLFAKNCAGCHGADGTQGPAPPLNDPLFVQIIPDAELLQVISAGRKGTPMSAFAHEHGGTLTKEQVEILATQLKTRWTKDGQASDSKTPASPTPAALPPYLAESDVAHASTEAVERGKLAYARACAMCHGDAGEGTEGAGALHNVAFLGLISDQALRRIIITGRPDLGMLNFAGEAGREAGFKPLTSAEIQDLVALLASWRQDVPTVQGPQP